MEKSGLFSRLRAICLVLMLSKFILGENGNGDMRRERKPTNKIKMTRKSSN